ncbi:hypothetical protein [Brevibacillus sp. BC25]|uniref:hypothetical protein n=1 Tax=Brevibacillus sp. BC25 TaxID=1144308 RepID=UPI0002711251|nr:hypothetical protein [Brevibacillus sp. BC25]EJL31452.1 hypothetical protein PMI05_00815 [Brevibacillus sp. BC25]
MISFRAEEVAEMPHITLFLEGKEPMAVAGFHVYDEAYVEIGTLEHLFIIGKKGWVRKSAQIFPG